MRLFVVRGRRFVADALIEALAEEPTLDVVGTATTPAAAVDRLRVLAADLVVVDASDDRERALDAVRGVRDGHPQVSILAFGLGEGVDETIAFAEAGARACLPRHAAFSELAVTLHELHRRRTRCPPALAVRLIERIRQLLHGEPAAEPAELELTEREREVLALVGEGLTNKEIAHRLGVAVATVKNHVHNLLAKLGVHRRQDAVRTAYLAGLVEDFLPRRAHLGRAHLATAGVAEG